MVSHSVYIHIRTIEDQNYMVLVNETNYLMTGC